MKFALIVIAFVGHGMACQVIEADHIAGKDLAAASPIFAALDPALIIGPAPLPPVQRVLHADELVRLARRNGIAISGAVAEVCFERAAEPLTAEKLLPVLRAALALDDAQLEILDSSRFPVPHGTVEFTRAGLSADGLWRGHVSFDQNRAAAVWARVRITTVQSWVEAAATLVPGKPIDATQLKLVTGPRFPFGPAPIASLDLATGDTVVHVVKAGEPIFASVLIAAREVERGDTVSVEVSSGAAHLSFDAVSQSSGRTGEFILLRNPDNGRYFQARVAGKDKASINK